MQADGARAQSAVGVWRAVVSKMMQASDRRRFGQGLGRYACLLACVGCELVKREPEACVCGVSRRMCLRTVGGKYGLGDAMATHCRRSTWRIEIKKTPAPTSRATYQALCKSISLHWLMADWPVARARMSSAPATESGKEGDLPCARTNPSGPTTSQPHHPKSHQPPDNGGLTVGRIAI